MVRKPLSVVEKPIKSLDEITPEFILEKERHWEEVRIQELIFERLKSLGSELASLEDQINNVLLECKIRTMRAISLGYDKKDLAAAFGVDIRTINKWAKGN